MVHRILVTILFTFAAWELSATHLYGGGLFYNCVDSANNEFVIKLVKYHDGEASPAPPSFEFVNFVSLGTGSFFNDTIPKVSIDTFMNPVYLSCKTTNFESIIKHTYLSDTLQLSPGSGGYDVFVGAECCHNPGLANLQNSGSQFQLLHMRIKEKAIIDGNSSPAFANEPVTTMPVGEPLNINYNTTDPDGDSISYRLCSALEDDTHNPNNYPPFPIVNYVPSLSGSNPVHSNPAITIDAESGEITGKATQPGAYLVKICIEEYRNDTLIGRYGRDEYWRIENYNNKNVMAKIGNANSNGFIFNCSDTAIHFNNQSSNATSYYWDFDYPNGVDTSSAANPSFHYTSDGNYTVMLVANPGLSCSDTAMATVKVSAQLNANFGLMEPACLGDFTYFMDSTQVSANDSITNWQWSFGDGTDASTQHPVKVFDSLTSYNVQLITSTHNQCKDTISKSTVVHDNPSLAVPDSLFKCDPGGMQINITSNAPNYQWSPGNGINCDTCKNPTFAPVNDAVYTVAAINQFGCDNIDSVNTLTVDAPNVGIADLDSICAGDTAILESAYQNHAYNWSTGDTTSSTKIHSSGIYYLTVTDAFGCTSVDSQEVNFIPATKPVIQPQDTALCNGENVTLSVNGSLPPLTWSSGATGSSMVASSAGNYMVSATYSQGCIKKDTAAVAYHSSQPLEIVSPTGVLAFCLNDSLELTTTHNYQSYQWSTGNTTASTFVTDTGDYHVMVADSNNCVQYDTISVSGYAEPAISFNPGDTAVCSGSSLQVTANSPAGNYEWSTGDTTATIQTGTLNNNATYYVTITSSNGCEKVDSVNITVNSVVQGTVIGDTSLCQNDTITLFASGFLVYYWTPDESMSNNTIATPQVWPDTSTQYQVIATDINGCKDTSLVDVQVNPAPTVVASATRNTVCLGDTVTLNATGASSYSWQPSSTLSCSNCPSPVATPDSSTVYTVTGQHAGGCVDVDTVGITTNSLPDVTISPDTTTICQGDTASLTASGGISYQWAPASGLNTTTGPTVVADPNDTTEYSVTATDSFGCEGEATALVQVDEAADVNGTITTAGGNPLTSSKVYLIKYNPIDSTLTALDSLLTDGNGNYSFETQELEVYVKVAPDSASYPNEIPTYYDSSLTWNNATKVTLQDCDSVEVNFATIAGNNPGGPGFISGKLSEGAGKSLWSGDPIAGATLFLMNDGGEPVTYAVTDGDGWFEMQNLPIGEYTLVGDIPNLDNEVPPAITLSGEETRKDSLIVKVVDNRLEINDPTGVDLPEATNLGVEVYPIPADDILNIRTNIFASYEIQIIDMNGRVRLRTADKEKHFELNTAGLSPGLYVVKIQREDVAEIRKFMITE